ncbi:6-phosphogluconolactonase [Microvirga lotononidis]|uniref:6-phosphogluconolactonase n=1 Tax=Microvirga lotononidis TaxID=864069 RepID=I4YQZ7_9HYPH|nr:6-phosphogluconolactonase [Microvirga lotononidis]EIM26389.1 6-phosphogluconolactonase/glucosamine-6-phosphate isomerase/deaminase [Microvirga lotononidis]WQO30753.1 6-phosphogluconolactonase [Microvirga lotononidis]
MIEAAVDFIRAPGLRRVSQLLADDVTRILRQAIGGRGRAFLAVPGGTTPREFLTLLGQRNLPWESIAVIPTDERDVPPDDPRSNEHMIRQCLPLTSGSLVPLRAVGASLEASATALSTQISAMGPLDVLVIGMGADAHIASLFPGDRRLDRAGRATSPVVLASRPADLEPRLSLGPAPLMAARWKALLISGQDKLAALNRAFVSNDPVTAPVRLLFEDGIPPRVYYTE